MEKKYFCLEEKLKIVNDELEWLRGFLPLTAFAENINAIQKVLTSNKDIVELLARRGIGIEAINELCALAQETLNKRIESKKDSYILDIFFKDPDGVGMLAHFVNPDISKEYFEYGEYAKINIRVTKFLDITSAKFIPVK